LWSLVNGNTGSRSNEISRRSQCLTELNRIGTVQTTGTVIPALKRCTTESSFGDRNTLSLSSRDTSQEIVSDAGVDCVADTKDSHDHIAQISSELWASNASWNVSGGSGLSSKFKGLSDCQHGEMYVHLCCVDSFTAEVLVHLLWCDTLVVDLGFLVNKEAVCLAGDCLEEGGASTANMLEGVSPGGAK